MRVAYMMTAYNEPHLLDYAVAALDPHRRHVFVHIDAKSDIEQFDLPHLHLTRMIADRVPVYWGNSSMLRATMQLLEEAVNSGPFDYYVLLSGSDFPTKPLDNFEDFLTKHYGQSFQPVRPALEWFEGRKRLRSHYILRERQSFQLFKQKVRFLRTYLGPFGGRRLLKDFKIYYTGSTWFTVHHDMAQWMLECWHKPHIQTFFDTVYCADEVFIPTVIANSPWPERRSDHNIRFIKWLGEANPKVIDLDDWQEIEASGAYFARKFSYTYSFDLLKKIGKEVHGLFEPGKENTVGTAKVLT